MSRKNDGSVFRPTHLFCYDKDLSCFTKYGTEILLTKAQSLLPPNGIPRFCYYIKNGRIIKYGSTVLDEEVIYDCYGTGALLFELEAPLQQNMKTAYKALKDSVLIQIPREVIFKEIGENPESLDTFMQYLATVRHHNFRQARESWLQCVEWRICKFLLTYAYRYGAEYDGKILITEKISQETIAKMLCISRVSVVRSIRTLRDMGLIEQINGHYCIRSENQLERHMQTIDNLLY